MHAVLAFSALPLFAGALLSDWAYFRSYEAQWANFSAWLIAAGLVLAGLALLAGLVDVLRSRAMRQQRGLLFLLLLLATLVIGFINALVHAKDGWAVMPTGLILSIVVVLLAAAGSAVGLARLPGRTA